MRRAIKHPYQCLAAAFQAPVLMFVSALICVTNHTPKKRGEAKSWQISCGKGSSGLDRGCCKSEGLHLLAGYRRALCSLCSQNIGSVNTVQHHAGFPAAWPCLLLLAGGQGRGGQGWTSAWAGEGRGRQQLSSGDARGEGMGLRIWRRETAAASRKGKAGAREKRPQGARGSGAALPGGDSLCRAWGGSGCCGRHCGGG